MIEKITTTDIITCDNDGTLLTSNLNQTSNCDCIEVPLYKTPVKGEIKYSMTSFSNEFMKGVKTFLLKNKVSIKSIKSLQLTNFFVGIDNMKFIPGHVKDFDIEINKVFMFDSFIKKCKKLESIYLNIHYIEKLLYDMDLDVDKGVISAINYLFMRYKSLRAIQINNTTIDREMWKTEHIDAEFIEELDEQLCQLEWTRTMKWALKKHSPSKIYTRRSCYEMWSSNIRKKGNYGIYSGYIKGYGKLQKDKGLFSIIKDKLFKH